MIITHDVFTNVMPLPTGQHPTNQHKDALHVIFQFAGLYRFSYLFKSDRYLVQKVYQFVYKKRLYIET